jgi:hypothetical protein
VDAPKELPNKPRKSSPDTPPKRAATTADHDDRCGSETIGIAAEFSKNKYSSVD